MTSVIGCWFWSELVSACLDLCSWGSSLDESRKKPPSWKDWLILASCILGTLGFFLLVCLRHG